MIKFQRTSITWKLFLVNAAMFLVFLTSLFVFQSLFLDKFYYSAKEQRSLRNIEEFASGYVENDWSGASLDNEVASMSDRCGIQLMVTDMYGRNMYGGKEMALKGSDGRETIVDLSGISFVDELEADGLKRGGYVRLRGVYNTDCTKIKPYEIDLGDSKWTLDGAKKADVPEPASQKGQYVKNEEMVRFEGTIEYLRLLDEDEYENTKSPFAALNAALKQWQENNLKIPVGRQIQDYEDLVSGNKYKLFIFPVTIKDGDMRAVFAVIPLQPVDEAVRVIKNYIGYVFLAALVFVLFLSYIYSRMVTKPLIEINSAALRMSRFDFKARCGITSRDELGSLSNSLNTMSSRLDSTVTELKEFVSNASHELKTPIAAMGVYVEALKDDIRSDKRERYLDGLQREVEKMNTLVQNMLELSRMESDSPVLNKEIFDLGSLAVEIMEEFNSLIRDKEVRIHMQTGQESAVVLADRARLGQVIRNFMSNALRHVDNNGEIWISITKGKNNVSFCIENQGIGIPEEKMDRIWERFYRIEPSRARENGGTGLGLAISSKILQLHDAQFGVQNTERGVMFYFNIPQ